MQTDERRIRWEKYTLYVDESFLEPCLIPSIDSLAISFGTRGVPYRKYTTIGIEDLEKETSRWKGIPHNISKLTRVPSGESDFVSAPYPSQ